MEGVHVDCHVDDEKGIVAPHTHAFVRRLIH